MNTTSGGYGPSTYTLSSGNIAVLIMNLPYRFRWQDLKDLCRQACADVRADVALEIDGRSRGFGQVTCKSREDADRLRRMYDGFELQGRRLQVIVMDSPEQYPLQTPPQSFAQPPGRELPGPFRNAEHFLADHSIHQLPVNNDRLLYIGNLPYSMRWQELKDLLRSAGRIQRTEILTTAEGRSRGTGTALFSTAEEAQNAIKMFNDLDIDGRRIKVRLDRSGSRIPDPNSSSFHGHQSLQYSTLQHQAPPIYPLMPNFGPSGMYPGYDTTQTQRNPSYPPQYHDPR